MSLISDFETALQAAVATIVGETVPVIFAHENGPRPDTDYIVLHTHLSPKGRPYRSQADSEGIQSNYYDRVATVTFFAYGTSSTALLEGLQSAFDKESQIQILEASGIAIRDVGPINDMSIALDGLFETRDGMEVSFAFMETVTDDVSFIGAVEYSGQTMPPQ